MSRESEKVLKQINKYLKQEVDSSMTDDEISDILNGYLEEYAASKLNFDNGAMDANDYYDLALEADTEDEALEYLDKALELEPDNIDVLTFKTEISVDDPIELLENFRKLIKTSGETLKKNGCVTDDDIGDYWGIIETRPYIRLRLRYMSLLLDSGMLHLAAEECEEIIRYNENDNNGIRYTLMHIYAQLEDSEKALKLHQKFDESDEAMMLLPLSVLFFKLGDYETAKTYLKRLLKTNKDTKKFFRGVAKGNLEKYANNMNPEMYRPFSIEELIIDVTENSMLFSTVPFYFYWANDCLKKM